MTRNEKKTAIENMAERFMNISDLEGKSMAIMVIYDACPMFTDDRKYQLKCRAGA